MRFVQLFAQRDSHRGSNHSTRAREEVGYPRIPQSRGGAEAGNGRGGRRRRTRGAALATAREVTGLPADNPHSEGVRGQAGARLPRPVGWTVVFVWRSDKMPRLAGGAK